MRFWGLVAVVLVGVFAFVVGQRLSADAVGMAVGVLFGVLAGVPAALLVLASGRRRRDPEHNDEDDEMPEMYGNRRSRNQSAYGAFPPHAPVIVFAPPAATPAPPAGPPHGYANYRVEGYPGQHALPGPANQQPDSRRAFKVVGEQEEWITEW